MKQTLNQYQFVESFLKRCPDSFSRAALFALFDYYGELEREAQAETEFDPVSICCDWTEYASATEAAEAHGWEREESDDEKNDTSEGEALQYLHDETTVLELSSGYVVLNF
jgi:hypothetical protein